MIDERTAAALARLTDNERAVLVRRLQHQTAKEMAIDLGISPHAVEKRLKMARTKLGVSSSLEAARLLVAQDRYGLAGPHSPDLGEANAGGEDSRDPAMDRPDWRRIAPFAATGVLAMSLAVFALLALNAPQSGVAPLPAAGVAPMPASGYLVQLLLKQGDRPLGSPKLIVAPGQTARATATNGDGTRYDISLTVEARAESAYLVKMDVEGSAPGAPSIHATPAALVKAGEPANLTVGPANAPLNVTLVLTQAGAEVTSGITTMKHEREKGGEEPHQPLHMVKASRETVRAFVNESFDIFDTDRSNFIERAEAPERQGVPVNPVEYKGKPDFSKVSPEWDENAPIVMVKGPMGQAAWISIYDKDADGKVSRAEYMDGNFEKFMAWGVPENWRGAPKVASK